jgi:hypothetical protein
MVSKQTIAQNSGHIRGAVRRDSWWISPICIAIVFFGFVAYATWAALANQHYWGPFPGPGVSEEQGGPYLSPFYSPGIFPDWWPKTLSPALLFLWIPLGFRITCYYFRKAYYRALFLDPVACAIPERRVKYRGETAFPFILQNLHRFFWYLAAALTLMQLWHLIVSFTRWGEGGTFQLGIGLGNLFILADVFFLCCYVFSCHSWRHLIGGKLDCFSCTTGAKIRCKFWRGVSKLNVDHGAYFWASMISIGVADLYIRLCSMGVIADPHIVF